MSLQSAPSVVKVYARISSLQSLCVQLACQDLGFGPPSDYERTIRSKGARLGKHTAAGLTDASLSRYFDSSCVGELPSCAVPTFTSRKSESIANLQQVVLRCNGKT